MARFTDLVECVFQTLYNQDDRVVMGSILCRTLFNYREDREDRLHRQWNGCLTPGQSPPVSLMQELLTIPINERETFCTAVDSVLRTA
jgi:hypothetical protein